MEPVVQPVGEARQQIGLVSTVDGTCPSRSGRKSSALAGHHLVSRPAGNTTRIRNTDGAAPYHAHCEHQTNSAATQPHRHSHSDSRSHSHSRNHPTTQPQPPTYLQLLCRRRAGKATRSLGLGRRRRGRPQEHGRHAGAAGRKRPAGGCRRRAAALAARRPGSSPASPASPSLHAPGCAPGSGQRTILATAMVTSRRSEEARGAACARLRTERTRAIRTSVLAGTSW